MENVPWMRYLPPTRFLQTTSNIPTHESNSWKLGRVVLQSKERGSFSTEMVFNLLIIGSNELLRDSETWLVPPLSYSSPMIWKWSTSFPWSTLWWSNYYLDSEIIVEQKNTKAKSYPKFSIFWSCLSHILVSQEYITIGSLTDLPPYWPPLVFRDKEVIILRYWSSVIKCTMNSFKCRRIKKQTESTRQLYNSLFLELVDDSHDGNIMKMKWSCCHVTSWSLSYLFNKRDTVNLDCNSLYEHSEGVNACIHHGAHSWSRKCNTRGSQACEGDQVVTTTWYARAAKRPCPCSHWSVQIVMPTGCMGEAKCSCLVPTQLRERPNGRAS